MRHTINRNGKAADTWRLWLRLWRGCVILIPDGANKNNKVPAATCLPGSIHSKEFIAGEPLLDCPKCRRQDILAALAPKYLALNEGGPEYHLDMIRYAYQLHDSLERLQITHYPKYQDETKRSKTYESPLYGLSEEDFLHIPTAMRTTILTEKPLPCNFSRKRFLSNIYLYSKKDTHRGVRHSEKLPKKATFCGLIR